MKTVYELKILCELYSRNTRSLYSRNTRIHKKSNMRNINYSKKLGLAPRRTTNDMGI